MLVGGALPLRDDTLEVLFADNLEEPNPAAVEVVDVQDRARAQRDHPSEAPLSLL